MTAAFVRHTPLSTTDKQALDALPVFWIETQEALYQVIDEIDGVDRAALDTEFIKRDTYYPILALMQINTGQAIYLLDAPKLNLTDLWAALCELPQMIWYACGEDLGIFYHLANCGRLNNVFDVQLGVAYLSGDLQLGYSRAIADMLGVELPKSESQSDWLVRPLSQKQQQYAADDVRYLLALHDAVYAQLVERGIASYAQEDSMHYAHELYEAQHIADEALYLDHLMPQYTHLEITLLQALMAWRESLARAINIPKTFVISKQALREIVEQQPTTLKALSHTSLNRGALRKYGETIVDIVKRCQILPADQRPAMPVPIYHSKHKPFKNALNQATAAQAKHLGIPQNLLLKNRWLQSLYLQAAYPDHYTLPAALDGYRRTWIDEVVMPLLSEHQAHFLQVFDRPA